MGGEKAEWEVLSLAILSDSAGSIEVHQAKCKDEHWPCCLFVPGIAPSFFGNIISELNFMAHYFPVQTVYNGISNRRASLCLGLALLRRYLFLIDGI